MSQSTFDAITMKIMDALGEDTVPWRMPWARTGPQRNLTSRRRYRGINAFLLAIKGYASPYWITPAQLEKLGGRVKENEEPTDVISWSWWQRTPPDSSRPRGVATRTVWVPGFWFHLIYNTDQCAGIDAHLPKMKKHNFTPLEACEKVVAGMPNRPHIKVGESKAYYLPPLDWVNMPNAALFESDEAYYAILFHELVHSTGHESRLRRHNEMKYSFDPDDHAYSNEELVAEMGAAMLCAHAGIDGVTIENSATYINHWMGHLWGDKSMLFYAALAGQKAADYILGRRSVKKPEAGSAEPQ